MIVDFHTHIFSPFIREHREEYIKRDSCFALLYANPKARLTTAEELIASMDEAGVDHSVALNIGWSSHELCVETNDYILEAAARYPDRLSGFCCVQPAEGEVALTELERCIGAGARGIGEMRSDMQGFDPVNAAIMPSLVEIMTKHNMIFLTHSSEPAGHQYYGKGSITPGILYSFLARFPELKLVCAHWGGGLPFYALMPEVSRALSNVFYDTAATIFLYQPQIFSCVGGLVGSDKILFGSDYPLIAQERIISHIQSLEIPVEDKQRILGGNAAKLLFGC